MAGLQLPPGAEWQAELASRAQKERLARSGLGALPSVGPLLVLPYLLTYWGIRKVYRIATGYTSGSELEPGRMTPSDMRAVMEHICPGSGAEADEGKDLGTCGRCGQRVDVANGKFLTHSS